MTEALETKPPHDAPASDAKSKRTRKPKTEPAIPASPESEAAPAKKPTRTRKTAAAPENEAPIVTALAGPPSPTPETKLKRGRKTTSASAPAPGGTEEKASVLSQASAAPAPPAETAAAAATVERQPEAPTVEATPPMRSAASSDAPARQEAPQQGGGQQQGGQYQRRFDKFRFRDRNRGERGPQQGDRGPQGDRGGQNDRGPQGENGSGSSGDFREQRQPQGERGDRPSRDQREFRGGPTQEPERDPNAPIEYSEGILELSGKGFGFLRETKRQFAQHPLDTFVTPEVCRKYNLRDGMWIKGEIRKSNRGPQMYKLTSIHDKDPEEQRNVPNFEELTVVNPKKRIRLETTPDRYTTRVMDLMAPIGKGQRGLLVAPPRTGKTTYLRHIAEAVEKNHPEIHLIVLLVDERPEEVTEFKRTIHTAELMASSNDSDLKSHTKIATLAMERAKRLVEIGKDVFILLDSITRVGRAFNNVQTGGRTMSGGIDARAMEIPRKIFAAARNTEEAGSLTIMATALIQTGSRMDDVIFQEFKGTGNMELVLDRAISDQRIFPAVDIYQSGTRREELLLAEWELEKINVIRRGLAGGKPIDAIERLLTFMRKSPTNSQMLASIPG